MSNNSDTGRLIMDLTIQVKTLYDLLLDNKVCTEEQIQTKINENYESLLSEIKKVQDISEAEAMSAADV